MRRLANCFQQFVERFTGSLPIVQNAIAYFTTKSYVPEPIATT